MSASEIQNFQNGDSTESAVDSTVIERRGGARPGAGRPPGPEQIPRIPKKLREQFAVQYKREMRGFASEFFAAYKRAIVAGDSKILIDAANRLMGRPVTSVELSGPGGQPIRMQAAAAVALALSDPVQLSALAAFSRLVAPDAEGDDGEDGGEDGEPQAVAGELVEGEQPDPAPEAPQDIISRQPAEGPPQIIDTPAVDPLGTDIADWLKDG